MALKFESFKAKEIFIQNYISYFFQKYEIKYLTKICDFIVCRTQANPSHVKMYEIKWLDEIARKVSTHRACKCYVIFA